MNKAYLMDVYIQLGAKKTEIAGKHDERLKIRLKTDPVDGKANKALIDFFADLLQIRKQDIKIIQGEKSRFKTLSILAVEDLIKKLIEQVEKGKR